LPENLQPETVVDISHESLMRVWKRLRGWADEEAASSTQYLRLTENARLYGQGTIGLLADPELAMVLEWRKTFHVNSAWAEQYNGHFAEAMQFLDRSEAKRNLELAERERARKRKFRQIQTVAGVLAALTILALYSAWTARRERLRAETNLAFAKKAVDESLSSAGRRQAREAGNSPEVEELRKELLDKAAAFYTEFTKQSPRNEALAFETIRAHLRLGDINRLLGKHQDAVQEYQLAISKLRELINNRPAKPEYLQALGYAYNWLGETIRSWWESSPNSSGYSWTDAEKQYELALAVQQQLHDQSPGDSVAQQELARTYYNRGIVRYDGKNKEGAESDFRTAIALLDSLSGKEIRSDSARSLPDPRQELARSYNNLANVLKASNPQQALPLYQHAIDLTQTLSTIHPEDREYRVELAEYLNNQAIALLQSNQDLSLAEQRNHESIHLLEQLITPSPSLSMDLVKSLEVRTEIVTDRGPKQIALEESDRLFELLGQLRNGSGLANHPELHVFYMNLGINYAALARSQIDSGDIRGAEVALEKLVRVLPEVSVPDRETLTAEYRKLRNQVEGRTSK
jgi:tetratricopeptide (TPR) repeat protein